MSDPDAGSVGSSVAEALEAILARISGIRAARVVAEEDRISEIHIIADTGRAPKQLVRDIQSAAKASLDLEIDYRTVSIVQLDASPAPAGATVGSLDEAARMPLVKVVAEATGQLLAVEVVLGQGPAERIGTSRGIATDAGTLVARATLEAYADRIGPAVPEVLAAEAVGLQGHEVAVVVVRLITPSWVRQIAGAAVVGAERNDAFARATLDAVNRLRS